MSYESIFILVLVLAFPAGWIAASLLARRDSRAPRPGCRHDVQSDVRWTEEGWVSVCLVCREWIYHGDGDHPTK